MLVISIPSSAVAQGAVLARLTIHQLLYLVHRQSTYHRAIRLLLTSCHSQFLLCQAKQCL